MPRQFKAASLSWTNTRTGEQVASIGYEANLEEPAGAWVRLRYNVNGKPMDYQVPLETTPCRFGGVRWWWNCPRSGRRVRIIHLPPGETMFVARTVHGLPYRSQRETPIDRSHTRQRRLYARLGGKYALFEEPIPRRPKGMHRATYDRLEEAIYAAIEHHDDIWLAGTARFLARSEKVGKRR